MTTFADKLARRIREDPGSPLVTFYDLATDERVELSVATYANWVAKTAGLLAEEHGLERGARIDVDLPTHWLGPVFLGAAWTLGLVVGPTVGTDEPDAVVCGPAGLARWASYAARIPVLACSLLPLGVRFADPLPAGVHDVGLEVWSQPDAFTPWDPPTGSDLATDDLTHEQLWGRAAAAGSSPSSGGRLLSTANPASPAGLVAFAVPLAGGGSLVLVSGLPRDPGPAEEALSKVYADERCTERFAD